VVEGRSKIKTDRIALQLITISTTDGTTHRNSLKLIMPLFNFGRTVNGLKVNLLDLKSRNILISDQFYFIVQFEKQFMEYGYFVLRAVESIDSYERMIIPDPIIVSN